MRETAADYQYLLSKLEKYGLRISGKTKDKLRNRGEGINDYLKAHPEIDDFSGLYQDLFLERERTIFMRKF
jgi:hypothetical protein